MRLISFGRFKKACGDCIVPGVFHVAYGKVHSRKSICMELKGKLCTEANCPVMQKCPEIDPAEQSRELRWREMEIKTLSSLITHLKVSRNCWRIRAKRFKKGKELSYYG